MTERLNTAIEDYKSIRNLDNVHESRWLLMLFHLIKYKEEHGNTDVPAKYNEHQSLAYWVRHQRMTYNQGKIDPLREQLLRLLEFNFRLLELHDWDIMFEKLIDFKIKYGHVRVTEGYYDVPLFNWLMYQRKLNWRGKLAATKIKKLINLGVDMHNKTINQWDDKFAQLAKFKEKNGHLYVCKHFGSDDQLINFVKVIRRHQNKISDERRANLDNLGFIWNPGKQLSILLNKKRADEAWLKRYEELKEYKEKFGTCRILKTSSTHHSLAYWISVIRNNPDKLTPERLKLLDEIDFFKENNPQKHKKKASC
ncbi:MAG: helicase associated domain-containing protein [Lentimicrobiaceae bacterium]